MIEQVDLNELQSLIKDHSKDIFKFAPLLSDEMPDISTLATCSSCFNAFSSTGYIYNYCYQIAEFVDFNEFSKGTKLECLSNAVALRRGAIKLDQALNGVKSLFETLLIITSYLAIRKGDKDILLSMDYLEIYNVYKYHPIELSKEEYDVIYGALARRETETDKCLDILKANYEKREKPACPEFLAAFKTALKDERAFDYYPWNTLNSSVLEERALAEMLSISASREGKPLPKIKLNKGPKYPDPDLWTPEVLSSLKAYFAKDEDALFCLEVICFLCFKDRPSDGTQKRIAQRALKELESKSNEHDSFLCLLGALIKEKKLNKDARKVFFVPANKTIEGLEDLNKLRLLIDLDISTKIAKERIDAIEENRLNSLLSKDAVPPPVAILDDPYLYRYITSDRLRRISELFYAGLSAESGDSSVVLLYELYGDFLSSQEIKEAVKDDKLITSETLKLWKSWKRSGYEASTSSLQTFDLPSITIPTEKVDEYNKTIMNDARNFGWEVFSHGKANLRKQLETWNSNVLFDISQIDVNKDFPQTIDQAAQETTFTNLLIQELSLFSSHFVPRRDAKSYINQYYDTIKLNSSFAISLFNKTAELYETISQAIPDARLLKYEKDQEISLAYVLQFFPLLENLILEDGVLNGIPPLNPRNKGLKERIEPSDMLFERMKECFDRDGDLESVSDLIAVYHMMYDKKSLNIRNSLVRGTDYPPSCQELDLAFKATLISVAIMIKRIQTERNNDEYYLIRVVG